MRCGSGVEAKERVRFGPVALLAGLAGGLVLAAAPPARAHTPPPVYLSYHVTDEELSGKVVLSAKLFRGWFHVDPAVLKTPGGEAAREARRRVQDVLADWSGARIDRLPVKGVVRKITTRDFIDHGFPWHYVDIDVAYGLKGRPREVAVLWRKFESPDGYPLDPVEAELAAWEGGAYFSFTPKEPEFIWHAPRAPKVAVEAWHPPSPEPRTIRVPLFTAGFLLLALALLPVAFLSRLPRRVGWSAIIACGVLAGALSGVARTEVRSPFAPAFRMPDAGEARLIFETLHRNIYRAFDYDSESDIYDTLARSVTGELLDDVYTEVYQSLILQDAGGAVCKVQSTRILDAGVEFPEDPEARYFRVKCKWLVHGKIAHWGHTHQRTNQYRAVYTVAYGKDGWRIAEARVLDEKRVEGAVDDGWTNTRKKK